MAEQCNNYEQKLYTLSQLLKCEKYPIVVKIGQCSELYDNTAAGFTDQQEVLIQATVKAKYSHLRMLKTNSEGEYSADKFKAEFDEEFLIPMKYPGKLKFVHRPGSLYRFSSVSQVLQEMPRYVVVQEDMIAFPSNGIGKNTIITAGTKLEISKKYSSNRTMFLECSYGSGSFAFSERDRIDFVEEEDKTLYQMCDLVRCQLLPKTIRFQDVDAGVIVFKDEKLKHELYKIMSGPLELVGFVDVEYILGWVRDKANRTLVNVLIPTGLWNSLLVLKIHFEGKDQANSYIRKKYGHSCENELKDHVLYTLPLNKNRATWLRNLSICSQSVNATFEDSSSSDETVDTDNSDGSSDSGSYLTPISHYDPVPSQNCLPCNPERVQLPTKQDKGRPFKHIKEKIALKLKTDQSDNPNQSPKYVKNQNKRRTHIGIPGLPSLSHGKAYHKPECRLSTSLTDLSITGLRENENHLKAACPCPISGYELDTESKILQLKSELENVNISQDSTEDFQVRNPKHEENVYIDDVTSTSDKCGISKPSMSPMITPKTEKSASLPESNRHKDNRHGNSPQKSSRNRPELPIPDEYVSLPPPIPQRSKEISSQPKETESLIVGMSDPPRRPPPLPPLPKSSIEDSKTPDDFYRYTVNEVFKCFDDCGLKRFGELCSDNKLDGNFFRNLDLQCLKEDPFFLKSFEILKVQKIVVEGWRPVTDK